MSTQLAYEPGNFYVWRASDAFAIHLSLSVVGQLTAQISRAGNEAAGMCGILIGRTIDTPFRATIIEDFKLIAPTADNADSYDSADAQLEIACRNVETGKDQRALGFFRVLREGRLNLRGRDLDTFSRLFCETGKVALLIQTSRRGNESDAALFYWQHGGAYPRDFGFGFPLDAGQLAEGHPGWRYPDPLEGAQVAALPSPAPAPQPQATQQAKPQAKPQASQPVPPMPPRPVSTFMRDGIRWSRLLPTAALVVLGICALQLVTNPNRFGSAVPTQTNNMPSQASLAATPNQPAILGLTVTARPRQLEVRWNSEAAPIQQCERGVMKITESGVTQVIPFDQRELHDGYVAYTPTTNDVRITLDVTGPGGVTTSESIRAVAIP